MARKAGRSDNYFVSDGEIRLETTVGPVEVWLGLKGEVRIFLLNEENKATRLIEGVVADAGDLADRFERLGMVDREAAWYAGHIWEAVSPSPEPGLGIRRLDWIDRDFPEPVWYGGPMGPLL